MRKKLAKILKYVPTWSSMKVLGKSKVIQTSYLWLFFVPLAAKALANIPEQIFIPFYGETLTIKLSLPFSWKAFYASAVCFSTASLIFNVFCPAVIKKYDTFTDYEQKGTDSSRVIRSYLALYRQPIKHWPFVGITDSDKNYFLTHVVKYNGKASDIKKGEKTIPVDLLTMSIPRENLKVIYHHVMLEYDFYLPTMRALAYLLYIIGFITFGLVLLENMLYVYRLW
jgi:hypothetical protein